MSWAESHDVEGHVRILTSSFQNMIQAARINSEPGVPLDPEQKSPTLPNMAIEVNVENIVRSVESLLLIVDQAKRKAILQDFASRNALIEQREKAFIETEQAAPAIFEEIGQECSSLAQELQEELLRSR